MNKNNVILNHIFNYNIDNNSDKNRNNLNITKNEIEIGKNINKKVEDIKKTLNNLNCLEINNLNDVKIKENTIRNNEKQKNNIFAITNENKQKRIFENKNENTLKNY